MNNVSVKFSLLFIFFVCALFYYFTNFVSNKTTEIPRLKTIENAEAVVQWAQEHLPLTGTLQEDKDGFVYVKVDDGYINQLYPKLQHRGYTKPDYFRRPNAPGAHISVFYIDERRRTGKIKEIGKQFSFTIKDLDVVPPSSHEYIVLKLSSPELEDLRKKYGLKPLLKDHDFHITIAKRKHHPRHHKKER